MKVIGIEKFTYVSKKTQKEVKGCNVYLAFPIPIERGQGVAYRIDDKMNTRIFCTQETAKDLSVGDDVEVIRNFYGNVEGFRLL